MYAKTEKGFTLVEVMIVVGIIAILAGIFLVGSGRFRAAANSARIKADLQKIEAMQEVYFTSQGQYAATAAILASSTGLLPEAPVQGVVYTTDTEGSCAESLPPALNGLDADPTDSNNDPDDGQYCMKRSF